MVPPSPARKLSSMMKQHSFGIRPTRSCGQSSAAEPTEPLSKRKRSKRNGNINNGNSKTPLSSKQNKNTECSQNSDDSAKPKRSNMKNSKLDRANDIDTEDTTVNLSTDESKKLASRKENQKKKIADVQAANTTIVNTKKQSSVTPKETVPQRRSTRMRTNSECVQQSHRNPEITVEEDKTKNEVNDNTVKKTVKRSVAQSKKNALNSAISTESQIEEILRDPIVQISDCSTSKSKEVEQKSNSRRGARKRVSSQMDLESKAANEIKRDSACSQVKSARKSVKESNETMGRKLSKLNAESKSRQDKQAESPTNGPLGEPASDGAVGGKLSNRRNGVKMTSYKESETSDEDSDDDSDFDVSKVEDGNSTDDNDDHDTGDSDVPVESSSVKHRSKIPFKALPTKRAVPRELVAESSEHPPRKKAVYVASTKLTKKVGTISLSSPSKRLVKGKVPLMRGAIEALKKKSTPASEPAPKSKADCGISSSEDDSSDWEEVKDLIPGELERVDVKITLTDAKKKKKKGFDWFTYSQQLWRRYLKFEHEYYHKMELMCLFAHGLLVNQVSNDQLVKALTLSAYGKTTLKGKQCTAANITAALTTLKKKVDLDIQPLSQPSINSLTLLDSMVQGLHSGVLHRADELVLLMLGVLRGLGASVRLCMAWYPIPYRISHYQKQKELAKMPSTSKKGKGKSNSFLFSADKLGPLDQQVWLEVYDSAAQHWRAVDYTGVIIDDMTAIEEHLSKPITYIVSYDNAGKFKDLTQKYDSKWMTGTKKLRVEDKWWEGMIAPHRAKESKKSKQEDDKLQDNLERMPFPNTIGGFKDHPLYVLERHLLKFEAIYPRTSLPLGYTKTKEVIYSRSCVHLLHSREQWLKEGRQVKMGVEPYKLVKPRPTFHEMKNGIKITEATLAIFGLWQTEPYEPPTAENGIVPKNAYGNVDMYLPEMIPKGCVQIRDPKVGKVAAKMGIDCAKAMLGWDLIKGRNLPIFDGWIVCEEFEGALLAALDEYEEGEEKKAKEKVEKRVYDHWKKLIKGLLIRERLRLRYGSDNF